MLIAVLDCAQYVKGFNILITQKLKNGAQLDKKITKISKKHCYRLCGLFYTDSTYFLYGNVQIIPTY